MATEQPGTLPNPHDKSHPFIIVFLTNVLKLTHTNYLQWRAQIQATLEGYDLFGYLDGTTVQPVATITKDSTSTPNPAYLTWKRQDRLLFGSLLGTLSATVAPLVSQLATSKELWDVLQQTFARASRGHIKQLKDKLRSSTKNTTAVSEYLQSIKITADLLASLGSPVHIEDLTDIILNGLDEAYKPIIDAVHARDCPISFLLLPCRHLCCCKACEASLYACPVCNSTKQGSIEALFS